MPPRPFAGPAHEISKTARQRPGRRLDGSRALVIFLDPAAYFFPMQYSF